VYVTAVLNACQLYLQQQLYIFPVIPFRALGRCQGLSSLPLKERVHLEASCFMANSSEDVEPQSVTAESDILTANNTSLHEECSSLKSRLMCIRGFSKYFQLLFDDSHQLLLEDPVTELWDLFSLGIPLCYIFDQLSLLEPGFTQINNSDFDEDMYAGRGPDHTKKHAIGIFAIHIQQFAEYLPGCELFTVTDLWDRRSTDGFVKVIGLIPLLFLSLILLHR
jgi:hypothetical protein